MTAPIPFQKVSPALKVRIARGTIIAIGAEKRHGQWTFTTTWEVQRDDYDQCLVVITPEYPLESKTVSVRIHTGIISGTQHGYLSTTAWRSDHDSFQNVHLSDIVSAVGIEVLMAWEAQMRLVPELHKAWFPTSPQYKQEEA